MLARQSIRYRVLRLIYDICEGTVDLNVQASHLQTREGISAVSMDQVLGYLRDEKLINAPTYSIRSVSLRHKGLVEIERAILHPTAGTEHFDAKVISMFSKPPASAGRSMRIADSESE